MKTASIYVRISSDVTGQGLGVARQEADCRALIEARGWTFGELYRDNDVSAYSGKRRPDYERLMQDVESGKVHQLVAWHPDRLHRSPRELERFIDVAERTGLQVETVQAGAFDLSTASGRAVARTVGAWARFESEHKSDRIVRKLEQKAAEGRPVGGMRPYGWELDKVTPRESEAAVLREAARRVLAGEPIRALLLDFSMRGLRTSTGKPWTHNTLRGVLLHARHAGIREYKGQEVGPAVWPAIIAPDDWRAMRRLLLHPDRVKTPGRAGKLHLLSGIATCGVCGSFLRVGDSNQYKAYRCRDRVCVSRRADRLEEAIEGLVIARLKQPDAAELLLPPDDGGARAAAAKEADKIRRRLNEAAEGYSEDKVTMAQLTTINERLRPRLAELDAASAPPPDRVALLGELVKAEDVEAAWRRTKPNAKREVIRLLMDIKIQRTRKGNVFTTDGIEVIWKE